MAGEKTQIEIKFIADGDKELINAIKLLNKETQKLNKTFKTHKKNSEGVAGAQKLLNQRVSRNTQLVNNNNKAFLKLQSTIAVYRNKMLLASFATGLLIRPLINLVKLSADFEDLERGFENLGRGIESSTKFLDKLRVATNGTVDDMVLMEQANNAMMLGVVKSEDEMADLFDMAQRLGQALGKDTVHSIESMVTGMGRQSKLMLDNIGIMVRADDAYKRFAQEQGLLAKNLNDAQKKTAFNNEVLRKGSEIMEMLGDEVLSTNQHIAAMQVSTIRLGREFGKVLEPVLIAISKTLVLLANNIDANLIKSFVSAVAIVGLFTLAIKANQIRMNAAILTTFVFEGALKAFRLATILAAKGTVAFTAALFKNPLFIKAALVAGAILLVTKALQKYVFTNEESAESTEKFMKKTIEANNVNEDFKKSIQDNVNALQKELDILNADNDLHKMAIELGRDLTLANYGLHDSEIELFNALQDRKKELEEIARKEKEEIKRRQKIDSIIKEAALFGKDATLIALQDKQSIIAAELEHAKAIVARTNVEGVSTEESVKMQEQIEILEGTHKSIGDEIDRHIEKNKKLTDSEQAEKDALDELANTQLGLNKARREQLKERIEYLENNQLITEEDKLGLQQLKNLKAELKSLTPTTKQFAEEGILQLAESFNVLGNSMDLSGMVEQFQETALLFESEAEGIKAATMEIAGAIGAELIGMLTAASNKKIKALQDEAKARIEALRATRRFEKMSDAEKEKAEKKIVAEQREAIKKEFETQQDMTRAAVIMETAVSIMKALPNYGLAAAVAAVGAIQLATINSQQPPKMAQGGLIGGRRHSEGGTLIEAEQGEFVMSRNAVDAIGVENLNRMNMGGGAAVNVSFSGNVMSDDFIENEAIPKIREAVRRGSDIGVS